MTANRLDRKGRPAIAIMPRRVRIAAMVLFCVLVEAFCLYDFVLTNTWPYNHWLTQTVSTLADGRPVPPDNNGPVDYRVFWSVARLASSHQAASVYDRQKLLAFEKRAHTAAPLSPWNYPPTTIVPTYLTKIMSFGAGFLLWILVSNIVSMILLRSAGLPWFVVVGTAISPAALWNDTLGQFSLIAGSLLIGSLMAVSRRPVRAGVLAGVLTMKPQIGLLLPVVFLARRNVCAIGLALLTFLALIVLSLFLFGSVVWTAFFTKGLVEARAYLLSLHGNFGLYSGISILWLARTLGLSVPVSYTIQVIAALAAMSWCWHIWRDPKAAPLPRVALTTCLATFVTPYGYVYDLCAYSTGILLLAWDRGKLRPVDILLWVGPLIAANLSAMIQVLVTPAIIFLAALYAHQQMRRKAVDRTLEHPATLELT